MCDSYTPSLSVSVRSTVAPGYDARTAASTLLFVSPVEGLLPGAAAARASAVRARPPACR